MAIPFKYKGYTVEVGNISNTTKVRAHNNADDCTWLINVNTHAESLWHNFVTKVKKTIDDRIRYLDQTKK